MSTTHAAAQTAAARYGAAVRAMRYSQRPGRTMFSCSKSSGSGSCPALRASVILCRASWPSWYRPRNNTLHRLSSVTSWTVPIVSSATTMVLTMAA